MQTLMEKEAHLEWFDAYFGQRSQASFTVALGMLNGGGCYGPHFRAGDGREELYCVLGVWQTDKQGLGPDVSRWRPWGEDIGTRVGQEYPLLAVLASSWRCIASVIPNSKISTNLNPQSYFKLALVR
jgi:hypothetical protein